MWRWKRPRGGADRGNVGYAGGGRGSALTEAATVALTEVTSVEVEPTGAEPTEAELADTKPMAAEPRESELTEAELTEAELADAKLMAPEPREVEPTEVELTEAMGKVMPVGGGWRIERIGGIAVCTGGGVGTGVCGEAGGRRCGNDGQISTGICGKVDRRRGRGGAGGGRVDSGKAIKAAAGLPRQWRWRWSGSAALLALPP